jgi:diaminohydroxyphosphoribosylaminopyrimidine deaminase/5-amino-6-(5-phosphoribosylamino)uracil reductase
LKSAFLKQYPNSKLKYLDNSLEIHNFLLKNHNDYFINKQIYVTLEPCNHIGKTPSCANILKQLKLQKVYIGTLDTNQKASGGVQTLKDGDIKVELLQNKSCENLLLPFKLWQKDKFRFFKLAMRVDGSIDKGYITTQDSLNLVHQIRTKLDLLIIGGNTVRIDRPTLDSRFAPTNKACDIQIYSTQKNFDTTIPLFNIKNRKVIIKNSLIDKNFSMIEGGFTLLENLKTNIDMVMLFISHKENKSNHFDIESLGMKKIYSYFINQFDEIIFLV